jgi:hypothetical protein
MLVGTVCSIHAAVVASQIYTAINTNTLPNWDGGIITEPLYSAVLMALGFYLGQKKSP